MKNLIWLFLLCPALLYGQAITYDITSIPPDFDLTKVNDVNNTIPVPQLDYGPVDSTFLNNYLFAELIQSQDILASSAYDAIVRDQQSRSIVREFSQNLGMTEEQVLDSLQNRYMGRIDGSWRYRIIGGGGVNVEASNDTMYLQNGTVWATVQFMGSRRIQVYLVHPSVGPDTLFLNTPNGALWAGTTPENAFHALRHRSGSDQ